MMEKKKKTRRKCRHMTRRWLVVVVVVCCCGGVAAAAYEVSELGELMPWLGSGWNRGESGARARTTADACGQALGAFDRTAECLFFGEPSTASLVI